jgi:hypothetical protein
MRTKMTESKTKPTETKAPSYIAYHVRDKAGSESYWTRIGAAWPHADGKGLNLVIETVPLDGRITLRIPSEKAK